MAKRKTPLGIKQKVQVAKDHATIAKLLNEAFKAHENGMSDETHRKCKRAAAKRMRELDEGITPPTAAQMLYNHPRMEIGRLLAK